MLKSHMLTFLMLSVVAPSGLFCFTKEKRSSLFWNRINDDEMNVPCHGHLEAVQGLGEVIVESFTLK
jgi:hypothetical protein